MGMDVFGTNPDSKVGEYFRRNIWKWSALWGYCASVSPEAASVGIGAYLNDGDGLDGKDAVKVAATLREQLATERQRPPSNKLRNSKSHHRCPRRRRRSSQLSMSPFRLNAPSTKMTFASSPNFSNTVAASRYGSEARSLSIQYHLRRLEPILPSAGRTRAPAVSPVGVRGGPSL